MKKTSSTPQDQWLVHVCNDEGLLQRLATALTGEDFGDFSQTPEAKARALIGECALRHYRKYGKPVGALLNRRDVLAGQHVKAEVQHALKACIRLLKSLPTGNSAAVADQLIERRQARLYEEAIDEILSANDKRSLTPEHFRKAAEYVSQIETAQAPAIMSAAALLEYQSSEPDFIVQRMLPRGALTIMAGKKGEGKTTLALQLAISVVTGGSFLGHDVSASGSALVATLEDSQSDLAKKLRRIVRDPLEGDAQLDFVRELPKFPAGISTLERLIRKSIDAKNPYALVVVDPFLAVATERRGQFDVSRSDYGEILPLKRLASQFNLAVVLNCHSPKALWADARDRVMGTTGIIAPADALWIMMRGQDDDKTRRLAISGRSIPQQTMRLRMRKSGFKVVDVGPEAISGPAAKEILQLLKNRGPMFPKNIAEALDKQPNAVYQQLHKLHSSGRVQKKAGKYSRREM